MFGNTWRVTRDLSIDTAFRAKNKLRRVLAKRPKFTDSNIASDSEISFYENAIDKFLNDERAFRKFRRNYDYREILEHVNYKQSIEYLKCIEKNNRNYAKKDFLQKASSVGIIYGNINTETSVLASATPTPLGLNGTYYADDFVFGISNISWDKTFLLKSNSARSYGIKSNDTSIKFGYYVTPTTLASFTNDQSNASYTAGGGASAISDLKYTSNAFSTHTVKPLNGSEFVVLDLKYNQVKRDQTTSQNNTEISGNLRYYPEAKYYVEGGYTTNSGDYDYNKGSTLSVGAGYSFTPQFALFLTTSKFSGSVSAQNSSSTSSTITAGYRF